MKLNIAQVIGLNTDQKAAQVTFNQRDEDNAFLTVVCLICDDAFTKGRSALSELSDFYYDCEGSPAQKLNSTFTKAVEKFSLEGEFDLGLVCLSGKVLYLIGKGEVEVYLKRDGKISSLLSVGATQQLISGFLQAGDRILISTKTLINFLGEDLDQSLNLPVETWEEEMSAKVASADLEDKGLAGMIIEVEKEIDKQEKEEEKTIPSLPAEDTLETAQPIFAQGSALSGVSLPKKIATKILNIFVNVKRFFPESNRGRLILAVVLILIIGLGIGFKYKTNQDKLKDLQFNQTLQAAKDDFNAAKGLASLNPAETKSKLDLAKDKVSKALGLKPNNSDAQNLKKQIDQESSSILQQSTASNFPLFLDMDLIKKNFRAQQINLSTGKLLALDPAVKTLVSIDISKKSNNTLAGSEQLGDAQFASLNGGLAFVYSKDKGILRVDTTKQSLTSSEQKVTAVAKKDADWGQIVDLYGFSGNVYLLDSGKNQIWKYLPTNEGYSDKREYLNKGVKADFSGSIRMQIESSIYVLKSTGEILRFTRGDKDNFSYGGLDKGIKDPKSFFVSSETDNLYILDSGNSRLLILTKTGSYKGQISGDKFATSTDLVVDEKEKKVYLLDGSKIYTVDLK